MTVTQTTLRRATPGDEPFVRRVFVEATNAALGAAGLPDGQLTPLLGLQYDARLAQWRAAYPSLVQHVLERNGEPVGACCLAQSAGGDELRVVDLAVLPTYQRQGVARDALRQVAARGLPVRLSVWQDDRAAQALYAGEGFRPDGAATPVNGYLELVLHAQLADDEG
jgi:ribosomal protein S18 acetylase RimI-like enzyme